MTRIYRYILATDNGMAPCSDDGVLTLATCKPRIRANASIGDWVAGFMPGSSHRGELVWAGRIGQNTSTGDYHLANPTRSDAVYRQTANGFDSLRKGYHCDPRQKDRDTVNPVLVFLAGQSWYFGSQPRQLPDSLMHLAADVRDYRFNPRQDGDLSAWEAWLATEPPGIHGSPRDKLVLCPGCRYCGSGPKDPNGCGKGPKSKRRPKPKSC